MPTTSRQNRDETKREDPRLTRSTCSSTSNSTRGTPYLRKTRSYIVSRPVGVVDPVSKMEGITFIQNMEMLDNDSVGITVNHKGVPSRFAFNFKDEMILAKGGWKFFYTKENGEMGQAAGEDETNIADEINVGEGQAENDEKSGVEAGQDDGEARDDNEEGDDDGEAELEEAEEVLEEAEAEFEEAEQQYEGLRPKTQIDVQIDIPSFGKVKLDDYMSKTDAQYAHITKKVNEILDLTKKSLIDQRRATRQALNRK